MRRILIANLVILAALMVGFSYTGDGSNGFIAGESVTHTNMNEIDTALDALQAADTTLTNTFGSYLPIAGGQMEAFSTISLIGSYMLVGQGGIISVTGNGINQATVMSASGQIDDNDLAANAVDSPEIEDDTITSSDIGADAVGASELAADSAGTSEIQTDGVGAAEIAADAVGSSEIAADAVGISEIAADSVGTSEIVADGVGASEIAANAVAASEIAADSVGASELDETAAASFASITTTGAASFGGSSGASTFTVKNMADAAWYECGMEGSSLLCGVDADGTPDGTIGLTTTGKTTWTLRNTADSGYVECGVVGTTMTCAVDADGTPDGTL